MQSASGELTLGIDVGTTATKVLLLSENGEWLMESWPSSEDVWHNLRRWLSQPFNGDKPHSGHSDAPPTPTDGPVGDEPLLRRGERVTRVGITAHGPSAIVIRDGAVTGRSFHWFDEISEDLERPTSGEQVLSQSRAWLPSRIAQWERVNGPLGDGVVVQLKDVLNWQLTGVVGRDSRSMRGFSGSGFFHTPSEVIGFVTAAAAQLSGIRQGAAVICGCDDLTAGVFGLGIGCGEKFNLANSSEHVGIVGGQPLAGLSWLPAIGRLPALSYQATSTGGRTLQERFDTPASAESVAEFVAQLEMEEKSGENGEAWDALGEINAPVLHLSETFGDGVMTIGGGLALIPHLVASRGAVFGAGQEVSALGVARLAQKPLAVIFGAGKVGRGFLAQLLSRAGWRIHFVEKNTFLVNELLTLGEYTIVNLGTGEEEIISRFTVSTDDWRLADASLILTSLGATGLASWAHSLEGFDRPIDIILAENHPQPAALVRRYIKSPRVGVAQAQVLRSCIVPTEEQVKRCGTLTIQIQDHWTLPLDADALVAAELVNSVAGFTPKANFAVELTRKLYTYNAINAAVCYLGFLRGYEWLSEAANDAEIADLARRVGTESSAALIAEYGFEKDDQDEWCRRALAKYQDVTIRDPIERNGRDPIRKLSRYDRILGPLHLCLTHGLPHEALLVVLNAALSYRQSGDASAVELANMVEELGRWGALSTLHPQVDGYFQDRLG